MGLEHYRRKRRFDVTPEPRGGRGPSGRSLRFVIQKHDASRLHYDFRLELDGVLKSWAVPKGPSSDPSEKRLAVQVEDHPLDYAKFEGRIPAGQYGAGNVEIWDEGRWKPEGDPHEGLDKGSLTFDLEGRRLHGRWSLVRMGGRVATRSRQPQWLLIRSRSQGERTPSPAPSDVGRRAALPGFVAPQLATLVQAVPDDDGWLHELKYDGYRIQARIDRGRVTLRTRRGLDWTDHFPTVARALRDLPIQNALIDGEVAVLGRDGITHFQLLQNAAGSGKGVVFFAFDLLHRDGRDLSRLSLEERKLRLKQLIPSSKRGTVRFSDHVIGHGVEFHRAACEKGLEGIISKRRDAPYHPGRSRDWLKGKCRPRQEFVIGGFTEPAGSRKGLGALLLGVHEDGRLVHVGRVGTGFDDRTLTDLTRRLQRLERTRSPFVNLTRGRGVHWVDPQLVAEVSFATWTNDRQLRQASFEGLREDKAARKVTLERPEPSTQRRRTSAPEDAVVAGVPISHPDRVVFEPEGITKIELARFVEHISPWMLPHVAGRPLMILRCNQGVGPGRPCFVQKHPAGPRAGAEKRDPSDARLHLSAGDVSELVRLVQNGAVEIHTWGATLARIEKPDRMIFDLDPHESVAWARVVELARELRARLRAQRLPAFVKTSGGKGLHVMVPLEPRHGWDLVRRVATSIAEEIRRTAPHDVTLEMAKKERTGKVFLDVLRNVRGATCAAPYSPRARAGAPISMPLSWEQLGRSEPSQFTIRSMGPAKRQARRADPWKRWEAERARLPNV